MRALLALGLLLAIVLSGCASKGGGDGDGDDGDGASGSGSRSGTSTKGGSGSSGSASGTGTGSPPPNRAPSAQMTAAVAGGSAPLKVNFTLNGTDADGDALSWTLAFGDASANGTGTSLPANVTHDYTAPGIYSVTFVVSDGTLQANQTLSLNVTGGSAGAVTFTGSTDAACGLCSGVGVAAGAGVPASMYPCEAFLMDESGGDCVWYELPAGLDGKPFTATSTGGDPDLVFTDECARTHERLQSSLNEGPEAGTVPAGAGCLYVWEWEAETSTHTVLIG